MRQMAREACMAEVERHLTSFLRRRPYASFEEWIQELHPENLHTDPQTGEVKVDHRLYGKDGQHRRLWNDRVDPSRQVFASRPGSVIVTRSTPETPRLPITPRISITPQLPMTPRLFSTASTPAFQLRSAASTPAFPTSGHFAHASSDRLLPASARGPPTARGVCCISSPRCITPPREALRPQLTRVDGMAQLAKRTETRPEPHVRCRSIPPPAPLHVQLAPLPVLLRRPRQHPLVWSVPHIHLQRPPPRISVMRQSPQVPLSCQAGAGSAAFWPQTAACTAAVVPLRPYWPNAGVKAALQRRTTRVEVRAAALGGA